MLTLNYPETKQYPQSLAIWIKPTQHPCLRDEDIYREILRKPYARYFFYWPPCFLLI